MVVREFHQALASSPETAVAVAAIKVTCACAPPCRDGAHMCIRHAHADVALKAQALTSVVERSEATTMMGLEKELKEAAHSLERQGCMTLELCMLGHDSCAQRECKASSQPHGCMLRCCRCNETAISLKAGCQLFLRYTTRTSALDLEDFQAAKARIIQVRVPRPQAYWYHGIADRLQSALAQRCGARRACTACMSGNICFWS